MFLKGMTILATALITIVCTIFSSAVIAYSYMYLYVLVKKDYVSEFLPGIIFFGIIIFPGMLIGTLVWKRVYKYLQEVFLKKSIKGDGLD